MQRQYFKAIGYGSLTGGLTAFASIAYVLHRSSFPTPFNQPLDWIVFPLCPFVLVGYLQMPHLIRFVSIRTFEMLLVILNAALYSTLFVIIHSAISAKHEAKSRLQNEI